MERRCRGAEVQKCIADVQVQRWKGGKVQRYRGADVEVIKRFRSGVAEEVQRRYQVQC